MIFKYTYTDTYLYRENFDTYFDANSYVFPDFALFRWTCNMWWVWNHMERKDGQRIHEHPIDRVREAARGDTNWRKFAWERMRGAQSSLKCALTSLVFISEVLRMCLVILGAHMLDIFHSRSLAATQIPVKNQETQKNEINSFAPGRVPGVAVCLEARKFFA